jgi:hypothetical protein
MSASEFKRLWKNTVSGWIAVNSRVNLQNMHMKIKLLKIGYGISSIHPLPWQQIAGEEEGGAGNSRISASFTD